MAYAVCIYERDTREDLWRKDRRSVLRRRRRVVLAPQECALWKGDGFLSG